jgi:hypothetical protein
MKIASGALPAFRIYDPTAQRTRSRLSAPRRTPRGPAPGPRPRLVAVASPAPVAPAPVPRDGLPPELEREVVEILVRQPAGETIEAAYRRKEAELARVFAALTIGQARALHDRLVAARGDDTLATQFARLNSERRRRVQAVLAAAGARR